MLFNFGIQDKPRLPSAPVPAVTRSKNRGPKLPPRQSSETAVSWPAFTFSTLLCDRIMNHLRWLAKFGCRIPLARGMPLNPHREHVIAASSWNGEAS